MREVLELSMVRRLANASDFVTLPVYVDPSYLTVADPNFIADSLAYLSTFNGGCPVPLVNLPPTVTLIGSGNIVLTYGQSYVDQGVTVTDDMDVGLVPVVTGLPNVNLVGVYTINYTVTDSNGGVTSITRTVTVLAENQAPIITLNGDANIGVPYLGSYTELGAVAVDDYDGTVNVVVDGDTIDTSVSGIFNVTYTATDSQGLITVIVRTVTVGINQPPTMVLNGGNLVVLEVGDTYIELGVTAIDPELGDVSSSVQITGSVDTNSAGQYILTYQIFNPLGGASASVTLTRTIQVSVPASAYPIISFQDGSTVAKEVIVAQSDIPVIWSGNGIIGDLFQGAVDKDGNVLQITTNDTFTTTGFSIAGTFVMTFSATDPSNGLTTDILYTLVVTPTPATTFQVLKMDATDGSHVLRAIDNSGTLRGFNALNGSVVAPHILEFKPSIGATTFKISYVATSGALNLRIYNYTNVIWETLGALTSTGYTIDSAFMAGGEYDQGDGVPRLSVVHPSGFPVPSTDSEIILEYF